MSTLNFKAQEVLYFIDIHYADLPVEFTDWLTSLDVATYRDTNDTIMEDLFAEDIINNIEFDGVEIPAEYRAILEHIEKLMREHDAAYFRIIHL